MNVCEKKMRVCVIGAGPSGTAVLRAFQSAKAKGAEIPEIVCYEKQSDWGGLWNYTYRTGIDEHGEPVHGSMYRHLWSNGPKEALEFADYTFEEHFGKPIPSYPPREVLCDYIRGRVIKANVIDWVRFSCPVRWVDYDETTKKFTVTVHDHKTNTQATEIFDYCICCTGHFSTPNVPHFDGIENFSGIAMHSHDFREAKHFAGKNVMVVGSSYSAEDIGSQCWKYGAASITACYRTKPMHFEWPSNWRTVPLLTKIDGSGNTDGNINTCHFRDGSTAQIDVIILCTGYKHHFPFLAEKLRLVTDNRLWTKNLHDGVAFGPNPRMMYIGMQDQFYTFNMFDVQAWWARDVVMGRIPIAETAAGGYKVGVLDSAQWEAREATLASDEDMIRFQAEYVEALLNQSDYPRFDIEGTVQLFLEWEHHKHENIMTFRDHSYRSVMTGTTNPPHHTTWKDCMDDSIEGYVHGVKK